MGLEGLLAELLVAAILDSVQFESVRVGVDEMVLGVEIADWVAGGGDKEHHHEDHFLVRYFRATEVGDVLRHVMRHLRCRCGYAIVILDHTVVQLRGHSDNHVIVVRVEVAALGDIDTEWRLVVVAGHEIVGVVRETGGHGGGLGEFWGPHAQVGSLGLVDGLVWWPDSVMDNALTIIPLLEEVTAMLLMSGVDTGQELHGLVKLCLLETLVHKEIVFLMHGSVATLARTRKDLEASSQRC